MKKNLLKVLCLVLVLAMVFSFVACGKAEEKTEDKTEEKTEEAGPGKKSEDYNPKMLPSLTVMTTLPPISKARSPSATPFLQSLSSRPVFVQASRQLAKRRAMS